MEKNPNPDPHYHFYCLVRSASFGNPEYRGLSTTGLDRPTHPDTLLRHANQYLEEKEEEVKKRWKPGSPAFVEFTELKNTILTICEAFSNFYKSDNYNLVDAGIYGLAGCNEIDRVEDLLR